ncbi:MAG: hypothetical protein E6Q97_03840 [Desulfurellales bacterium]|nr:MAG: hypothetical protein E6Q97_03840 [Desulfurellales bacterium]
MPDLRFGPLTGLNNITAIVNGVEVGAAKVGALSVADDVLIDRDGWPATRPGLIEHIADAHSIWASQSGRTFAVLAGQVIELQGSTYTAVHPLPTDERVEYCDTPSGVLVVQGAYIGRVGAGRIGVSDADQPVCTPASVGGLCAGTYHVGVSMVSAAGEEGGLSPLSRVDVAANGGITISVTWPSDAASAIVYRTAHNGDVLHRCATIPSGFGAYLIGAGAITALPQTHHLKRMPGGRLPRWWRGRLLVARGDAVWHSHPYSAHLHDPRSSWLRLPGYVTMIEPVEGGIWLASASGVRFARGTDPSDMQIVSVAADPPPAGASALVNGDLFDPDLQLSGQHCAIWWGASGFVLGTPDGRAIALNQRTFRTDVRYSAGTLVVHGRRVTAFLR